MKEKKRVVMEVYGKIDISNAIITSHGFFAGQTTTNFQNIMEIN